MVQAIADVRQVVIHLQYNAIDNGQDSAWRLMVEILAVGKNLDVENIETQSGDGANVNANKDITFNTKETQPPETANPKSTTEEPHQSIGDPRGPTSPQ